MKDIPDYMIKAYELFKEEYQKHLDFFLELVENTKEISTNKDELYRRFHTIKGGSGFLALDKVIELSTEGESIFKSPELDDTAIDRFKEIVKELEKEQSNLT